MKPIVFIETTQSRPRARLDLFKSVASVTSAILLNAFVIGLLILLPMQLLSSKTPVLLFSEPAVSLESAFSTPSPFMLSEPIEEEISPQEFPETIHIEKPPEHPAAWPELQVSFYRAARPEHPTTSRIDFEPFWHRFNPPEKQIKQTAAKVAPRPKPKRSDQVRAKPRSAKLLNFSKPRYPAEAVRRRLEGLVKIRVTISPEGRVSKLEIVKSSGYALLDDAAFNTARQWRFNQEPVQWATTYPFNFHL